MLKPPRAVPRRLPSCGSQPPAGPLHEGADHAPGSNHLPPPCMISEHSARASSAITMRGCGGVQIHQGSAAAPQGEEPGPAWHPAPQIALWQGGLMGGIPTVSGG